MSKAPSKDQVHWIDAGHQPLCVGWCPSKRAWSKAIKRLHYAEHEAPYPSNSGCVTSFPGRKGGLDCVLVTLNRKRAQDLSETTLLGLLVHETTHVWQYVLKTMGEKGIPSMEWEAYSMQGLFMGLHKAMLDTWGPTGHARNS